MPPLPIQPIQPIHRRPLSRRAALAQMARCAALAASVPASVLNAEAEPKQPPTQEPTEPGTQNPQEATGLPPVPGDTPPDTELLAQSLDEVESYANWKQHIGKPDEAVCHVKVTVFDGGTSGAGQTVREGSGIIVRCDGWVLLPEALFGTERTLQKDANISLTFRAADGTPPKEALSPAAPPRYHSHKTDYVLVKVNGHHFKGLYLLDVRNLKAQMPVSVVWAAPAPEDKVDKAATGSQRNRAPKSGLPVGHAREAVVGGRDPNSSVPHFALTFSGGSGDELPPLGSAVIEPSCGGVLGVVTVSDAKGVYFSPFGYFQYVSNDVGLKVSIEDITTPTANTVGSVSSTGQMLTMVKIPGGPTRLVGEQGANYRFFYGTEVVCMPDFYIDAHPVTVGAYRDWLGNGAPRQPLGWITNNELRTRQRDPDIPVSGLIADDGLRYAAAHKKRVATPVEWARASMGAETGWMRDLREEWLTITKRQDGIADAKLSTYATAIQKMARQKDGKINPNFRPPEAIASPQPELDALSAQQQKLYYDYWVEKGRWFPYQHCPVGFYKEDMSKWMVGEVVSSVPEMCQPNYAARVYEPAPKPYSTLVDPYFSLSSAFIWLANCLPGDMDGNYSVFCVAVPPDDIPLSKPKFKPKGSHAKDHPVSVRRKLRPYVYFRDNVYSISQVDVVPRTGFGFRCAL